jgi:DNA-directed RNA polymerase subunit RPC12/RpoP
MERAIRYTCSHCQREIYLNPTVDISIDALSALACNECGERGAVLTLDIDAPPDAPILDRLPRTEDVSLSPPRPN